MAAVGEKPMAIDRLPLRSWQLASPEASGRASDSLSGFAAELFSAPQSVEMADVPREGSFSVAR